MAEPIKELFTVPDVIGLPFHVGRDLAGNHGVTLANPDPDGPPIGVLAWPGLFYIVGQDPPAGVQVPQWSSVAVEIVAHGGDAQSAKRSDPPSPRPSLRAEAEPPSDQD